MSLNWSQGRVPFVVLLNDGGRPRSFVCRKIPRLLAGRSFSSMNDKYSRTLEFDKILNRLAAHAAFSASEELARALSPRTDAAEISARQGETTEARQLLDQHSEMGVGGARDLRPLTRNARIGAVLTPLDLLEVRQTLTAARALRRSITRLQALYPRLAARAASLEELPAVVDAIARAINDRAEVADSASDELARLRAELNVVRIHEGDPVTITFDAISDLELAGRILRIEAIGENKMGDITYTAIIQPDRYDERLRWNMTASVVIEPK